MDLTLTVTAGMALCWASRTQVQVLNTPWALTTVLRTACLSLSQELLRALILPAIKLIATATALVEEPSTNLTSLTNMPMACAAVMEKAPTASLLMVWKWLQVLTLERALHIPSAQMQQLVFS